MGVRNDNNKVRFELHLGADNKALDSTTTPITGVWTHAVGVYDGANMLIYINGVLDASLAVTGAIGTSATKVNIGRSSQPAYYYNGSLDDIRIYNIALTLQQVSNLYNLADSTHDPIGNINLVGYWKFDENTGTIAADSSGRANTGTLSGATLPTWCPALNSGQSFPLSFDGGDYITLGSSNAFIPTGVFSMTFWVKANSQGTTRPFWARWTDGDGLQGIAYTISTTAMFAQRFYNGGGTNLSFSTVTGAWQHIGWTYDGTTHRTYVNGVDTGLTANDTNVMKNNISPKLFGANDGFAANFIGLLKSFIIYGRCLTPTEVLASYNGTAVSRTSILAEWLMKEGTGTTIADTSGNSNTGTFGATTAAPIWLVGLTQTQLRSLT